MLPTTVTTKELRALTAYSPAALVDLEQRGIIRRSTKNSWPVPETLTRIVGHLRDRHQRRSPADDELRRARAKEIEVRTAERQHELIDTEEALAVVEDMVGIFLTGLSGLPARVTRDLQQRQKIDDAVSELREMLSARCEEQAASLQGRGKAVTTPPRYRPEKKNAVV